MIIINKNYNYKKNENLSLGLRLLKKETQIVPFETKQTHGSLKSHSLLTCQSPPKSTSDNLKKRLARETRNAPKSRSHAPHRLATRHGNRHYRTGRSAGRRTNQSIKGAVIMSGVSRLEWDRAGLMGDPRTRLSLEARATALQWRL